MNLVNYEISTLDAADPNDTELREYLLDCAKRQQEENKDALEDFVIAANIEKIASKLFSKLSEG